MDDEKKSWNCLSDSKIIESDQYEFVDYFILNEGGNLKRNFEPNGS